ncbi:hypothetical protein C0989_001567 [Termitomyces sp. Mn162]|nr:hypothetical protein C0989_001567 [Termitomyces sp. Mn162]
MGAHASQAHAILAKIPLPGCPPLVVALLPTNGKETADDIHLKHLQIHMMAGKLKLPVVAFMANGAANELAAQFQMD